MKNRFKKKRISVRLNKLKMWFGESKPVLTDIQRKSLSVFREMVVKPDSTLLIDPLTNCCYVEYEHYFIKLESKSILIKNTTFSNYCEFDYRIGEKAILFFYKHVSKRRMEMEAIYDGNTLANLEKINLLLKSNKK